MKIFALLIGAAVSLMARDPIVTPQWRFRHRSDALNSISIKMMPTSVS